MTTSRFYVAYHRPSSLPKDEASIYIPIHVGAQKKSSIVELRDDTGDNISSKNWLYCELTMHYWVWKNILTSSDPPPFVGFFHYRRFLDFGSNKNTILCSAEDLDVYITSQCKFLSDFSLDRSIYVPAKLGIPNKNREVLNSVKSFLAPSEQRLLDNYLQSSHSYIYRCNMFAGPRDLIIDCLKWLFSILEPAELIHTKPRSLGFISEHLVTFYLSCIYKGALKEVGVAELYSLDDIQLGIKNAIEDPDSPGRENMIKTYVYNYIIACMRDRCTLELPELQASNDVPDYLIQAVQFFTHSLSIFTHDELKGHIERYIYSSLSSQSCQLFQDELFAAYLSLRKSTSSDKEAILSRLHNLSYFNAMSPASQQQLIILLGL